MTSFIDMLELPNFVSGPRLQHHLSEVMKFMYITISSHGQKLCENAIFICISNNIAKNV